MDAAREDWVRVAGLPAPVLAAVVQLAPPSVRAGWLAAGWVVEEPSGELVVTAAGLRQAGAVVRSRRRRRRSQR